MTQEEIEKDEVLEVLANALKNYLIYLMKESGKSINKEEAGVMLTNIGVYMINKNIWGEK